MIFKFKSVFNLKSTRIAPKNVELPIDVMFPVEKRIIVAFGLMYLCVKAL